MKTIIICLLVFASVSSAMAQNSNPKYDVALAQKLGADQYGMKSYILVILKTGSNNNPGKAFRDSCFAGHMRNIRHLVTTGKMIVAGPFEKNEKNFRGLFILNAATFAEADSLLEADPTVKEKIFDTEMYNWYGSAALPAYLEVSDKIWKSRP